MLVINRRRKQKVLIKTGDGQVITLIVVRTGTSDVRLAFDAPANCLIVREELLDRLADDGTIPARTQANDSAAHQGVDG